MVLVLILHYWRPFRFLGFTHSAGRRSCQSRYSNRPTLLYISSLKHPVSPRARAANSQVFPTPESPSITILKRGGLAVEAAGGGMKLSGAGVRK